MQYDYYAFDLTPFFESYDHKTGINKPLLQGSLVTHNGKKFRVDRWHRGDQHCYVFINISNNNIKPFGKKPSEIQELITLKKIIVDKYI